jgi:hypothetical protein
MAIRLRAQGKIVREGARYRLNLSVREGVVDSERIIESDSCADLAGAAAIALALLIRAEPRSRERSSGTAASGSNPSDASVPEAGELAVTGEPSKPPSAEREQATSKPPEPRASAAPPEAPRSTTAPQEPPENSGSTELRFVLDAPLLGVDIGPLPAPQPTLGFALGLRVSHWRLSLGARLSRAQTVWTDVDPSAGAEVSRAAAELRGCYGFSAGDFGAGPCVLISLERVGAQGVGDHVVSHTHHLALFAAGIGAFGRWQLARPLALLAAVGVEFVASRPRFVIDGLPDPDPTSSFAAQLSTGLEWSF